MWHPQEGALYWCDIPGKQLHRYEPDTHVHQHWSFDVEPACCAPVLGGGLILGMRDGIWRFDTQTGVRTCVAKPPYQPKLERFNDGKADPKGRFWVGTIYEPREPALAELYRFDQGQLERMAGDITVSNGLAWSPDARVMYWSDTKTHRIYALDFDAASGNISGQRVFAQFAVKQADQDLSTYGGRPDGAAMDAEACLWVAMFEGQRLLRLAPTGEVLQQIDLPVRCPTMPCFGGPDLRTLYITTARDKRPADELVVQPLAGHVLQMRVDVPGLPVNFVA